VLNKHYVYDAAADVVSLVEGTPFVRRLEYDKFGARAYMELGNGVVTQYTYEPLRNRLKTLMSDSAPGARFQHLSYDYDAVGNITSLSNKVAVPNKGFGGPVTHNFIYDDLYRLTDADGIFHGANGFESYTLKMVYSDIHNIESKTQTHTKGKNGNQNQGNRIVRSTSYDWGYTYESKRPHAPTQIGERTFDYDLNGNLIGWDETKNNNRRRIEWDEENRIRSVTDNGRETEFIYDAGGERVGKLHGKKNEAIYVNQYFMVRNGGRNTKHIWMGATRVASVVEPSFGEIGFISDFPGQGIYHWDPKAEAKAQVLYKNKHFMANELEVPARFTYFYHSDHLGSTSYVTDEQAQLFEHLEYFPFGETWVEQASNTHEIRYLFTSKELDEETGLYYFGARYYDPRTSVWQSPDPILGIYIPSLDDRITAMEAGNPFEPEKDLPGGGGIYNSVNVNLYHYAALNPLTHIDPNGLVDLNLFSKSKQDKNVRKWANLAPSPPNTFTVGAHGWPGFLVKNGKKVSAAKVAEMIRKHPNYKKGMVVRLLVCNAGVSPGKGKKSYGQKLADALGVEVEAPDGYVWYQSDGNTYVSPSGDKPGIRSGGSGPSAGYIKFKPTKKNKSKKNR